MTIDWRSTRGDDVDVSPATSAPRRYLPDVLAVTAFFLSVAVTSILLAAMTPLDSVARVSITAAVSAAASAAIYLIARGLVRS